MVIVGNGVAGFAAARRLRREDPEVTISLFSDEAHPFYLRNRLKDYVAGSLGDYEVILESRNLYRRERLNLFLRTPVLGLDTENREVLLPRGERVRYDRLLLAMGCAPAPLNVPGADLEGVFALRTLADAEAVRQWMSTRTRAVVIGEGIVSVHLAEALARLGVEVEYTLLGERLWPDVLDVAAGAVVEELLREAGVRIHKRVRVATILGRDGAVRGVQLDGGDVIPCDMLGHGCSFRPATALLDGTAVQCDDGVVVNEYLETSVADVFAAGDVISLGLSGTEQFGQRWRNSFLLGETAALNMLDRPTPVKSFGASLRTEVCDTGLAVVGRGHLAEVEPGVQVEASRRGHDYRRLVFEHGLLIGAILIGDTSAAETIEDHVQRGTLRDDMEESVLPALMAEEPRLTRPLATACPICTDTIHLPAGVLVGREFACDSCRTRLKLAYVDGRLDVVPA